jgi:ABC-2 type transport system ATP-binding protein
MIELDNITKHYGTKVAICDLTLRIEQGELFAFLGPNGAGKTTTIKLISGLLFPTAGRIRVGGYDIQTQGDQARQLLSYVPDQPYLYERLTGREFLKFIADMYGLAPKRVQERLEEVATLFRLDDFIDDLAERYSHGMRQRTVFAAALIHQPRVLVVDEPTVGLDPRSVRLLKDVFRRLAAAGTTVFLSTHSLDLAQEVAQRIGIVDHGRLIGCGTLESLRRQADLTGSLEDVFLRLTEETPGTNESPTPDDGEPKPYPAALPRKDPVWPGSPFSG